MTFSVLVAEPRNDRWASIVDRIRTRRPDAAFLRVKDGEQALRFLFHRGLFSDEPETPGLVLLAADLPVITTETIIARIRQHPRTQGTPVIVLQAEPGMDQAAVEALHRLCQQQPAFGNGLTVAAS